MKASEIPESYRITESDNHEAWTLFADRDKYFAVSDEERTLVAAFMEAGHMKRDSGQWPTLGEVYEKWQREAEVYDRRWIRSYHGPHRLTEKDIVEYETKLLAGEGTATRLTYMRIAVQLKQSTGNLPTIDEVRVLWEAEEEKQRAAQKV